MSSGGTLMTHEPSFDGQRFSQSFTFTSQQKVDGEALGYILTHAAKLFRGSLEMNGFHDHVWPPDEGNAEPASDFKGGVITLATRAAQRSAPIVVQ